MILRQILLCFVLTYNGEMDKNKILEQRAFFKNRLNKNKKHLLRWAKKNKIFAFRVYDRDIPEIPLCVDLYYAKKSNEVEDAFTQAYVVFALYKRPYEKSENEERLWLSEMQSVIEEVFETNSKRVFFKLRQKRNEDFNEFEREQGEKEIIVREGTAFFYIRLNSLLDTGLFLDHRFLRRHIFNEARDKSVLNLFSYTGSFSVQAKLAGAKKVISVDLSENYVAWAKENFRLNGLDFSEEDFIVADVFEFLQKATQKNKTIENHTAVFSEKFKAKQRLELTIEKNVRNQSFDIIICDAPTFSNSKKTSTVLDINRDWSRLCAYCLTLLSEKGCLYFSCNSKTIKINKESLLDFKDTFFEKTGKELFIRELSLKYLDEDFKNKKPHTLISFQFMN